MAIAETTAPGKPGLFVRFMDLVMDFVHASQVTAAMRIGREPNPDHLRALGIDPEQFRGIRNR